MATAVNRAELASIRFGDELARITERLRRATVQVRDGYVSGHGSGVIWSPNGVIVTNAHVVRSPTQQVTLCDGREFTTRLIARDPQRDLAVLRLTERNLPTLKIRDASSLRPGELVVAVGHPWGEVNALSVGVVHTAMRGRKGMLVADLRLAPGNSGGPLADAEGQLVGINCMIASGFAVAIPTNTVTRFLRATKAQVA